MKQKKTNLLLIIGIVIFFLTPLESRASELQSLDEQIAEEEFLGDIELLAQLCYAEAGNQGVYGMQLVADVVLNRVADPEFPDTIEEVIFQDNQFSVIKSGSFEKAGWLMTEDAFKAAELEMTGERIDSKILYFNCTENTSGKNPWKYKGHWFSY